MRLSPIRLLSYKQWTLLLCWKLKVQDRCVRKAPQDLLLTNYMVDLYVFTQQSDKDIALK